MNRSHGTVPLQLLLAFSLALVASRATPAAADPPPTSWEYPLLPHVQAVAFWPQPLTNGAFASVTLSAVYATECWTLVDATIVDAAHVSLTLAPCTLAPDSVSGWGRTLELGQVFTGIQPLTVTATLLSADGPPAVEQRTIGYEVVDAAPVPVDTSTTTLVLGISVTPSPITVSDPVTIHLTGRTPFACPVLAGGVGQIGSALSLRYQSGNCSDSSHAWQQDIALGVLDKGAHVYPLDVAAIGASGTVHELHTIAFTVVDPSDPPPPPVDSLNTVLSSSQPNPFREATRFSVSLDASQMAQVAVYDLAGRRVVSMYSGELPVGTSWLSWDGRRADGSRAPGGIYFYRLTLPSRVITRRVVLLGTP